MPRPFKRWALNVWMLKLDSLLYTEIELLNLDFGEANGQRGQICRSRDIVTKKRGPSKCGAPCWVKRLGFLVVLGEQDALGAGVAAFDADARFGGGAVFFVGDAADGGLGGVFDG